jgi:3'-phosphoadenosine 5'-phosphosulfate sulfotransferase (PAPS reductase)/FAD synthetase
MAYLIPLVRKHGSVWSWQGVRADESKTRSTLPERDEGDFPGVWNYRPILQWKAEDCFDMHKKHGIEWNPLYSQGMGRVGCMPCIMVRKGELAEIVRRFPEELARLAEWESLVSQATKRGSTTFFDGRIAARILDDENIHHSTHGVHLFKEWAMTNRKGETQDFGDVPVCASQYGLCE